MNLEEELPIMGIVAWLIVGLIAGFVGSNFSSLRSAQALKPQRKDDEIAAAKTTHPLVLLFVMLNTSSVCGQI
jgi:hypothetical protein